MLRTCSNPLSSWGKSSPLFFSTDVFDLICGQKFLRKLSPSLLIPSAATQNKYPVQYNSDFYSSEKKTLLLCKTLHLKTLVSSIVLVWASIGRCLEKEVISDSSLDMRFNTSDERGKTCGWNQSLFLESLRLCLSATLTSRSVLICRHRASFISVNKYLLAGQTVQQLSWAAVGYRGFNTPCSSETLTSDRCNCDVTAQIELCNTSWNTTHYPAYRPHSAVCRCHKACSESSTVSKLSLVALKPLKLLSIFPFTSGIWTLTSFFAVSTQEAAPCVAIKDARV